MHTIIFCVNGSACVSFDMLIFAILNVVHTRQSTKNTFLLKNDNCIAVHEEHDHIAIFAYLSARMVLYIKHVLFLLIDISMCIIQHN